MFFYQIEAVGSELLSQRTGFVSANALGDEVGPNAPQNLSAVADENAFDQVTLRWSAPSRDANGGELSGLAGFVVFRSLDNASAFVAVDTLAAGARQFDDSGLKNLTTYFYTLIAFDDNGNESSRATAVQVQTFGPDEVAPAAPQNLAAVADENTVDQATLRWSAPSRDADGSDLSGLAGFVVFRSEGNANSFVPVDTLAADARQFDDSGLESLTTYFYTLTAFDAVGNESSRAVAVQVQTSGLAAPSGLSAIGRIGQIQLSWQAANDDQVIGYNVYRSTRSDAGYVRLPSREGTAFTTGQTTYVDSNLSADALFFYQIEAVGPDGLLSQRTGFVDAAVDRDQSPPAAPSDLSAIAATDQEEITLNWNASNTDRSGGELTGLTAYIIFRSKDTATALAAIDTVDGTITTFVDTGLEPSTVYFYTLSATDANGNLSPRSAIISALTSGIASPANVSAGGGISRVTVSWQASTLEDLQGYNVYRSTRSDQGYVRLAGIESTPYTTGQTTFIDSGLVGDTIFFYRVATVTDQGESEFSAFSGATVQVDTRAPSQPTFVDGEAAPDDPERMNLNWKAPTTDINGALLTGLSSYLIFRADNLAGPFDLVGNSPTNTYSDTGLVAQTIYYYQVVASDEDGNLSPRSSTAILTTNGVGIPQNVQASASSPTNGAQPAVVILRWDASLGSILFYEVQRTTVEGSTDDNDFTNITPNTQTTGRTDNTVSRNTTYYYRVRARDTDQRVSEWTELLEINVLP